jgi:hypothetical protein
VAQQVVTQLLDDIDGSEAQETVTFAYRGHQYEIDLNAEHATELDEALSPYIEHARRLATPAPQRRGRRTARGNGHEARDTRAIREWARQQGIQVSARGRIPAEIQERYNREAS